MTLDASFVDDQTRINLPEVKDDFKLSVTPNDDQITLSIEKSVSNSSEIKSLYFLPYENGILKNTAEQNFKIRDDGIGLIVEYDQFKTEEVEELYGILIFHFDNAAQLQKAYEIKKQINTNN